MRTNNKYTAAAGGAMGLVGFVLTVGLLAAYVIADALASGAL